MILTHIMYRRHDISAYKHSYFLFFDLSNLNKSSLHPTCKKSLVKEACFISRLTSSTLFCLWSVSVVVKGIHLYSVKFSSGSVIIFCPMRFSCFFRQAFRHVSFPRVLSLFKIRTQCSDTTLSFVRAVLGTDEILDCWLQAPDIRDLSKNLTSRRWMPRETRTCLQRGFLQKSLSVFKAASWGSACPSLHAISRTLRKINVTTRLIRENRQIYNGNWAKWFKIGRAVQVPLKSQVWFQTKIARREVQLPLYYSHFEIVEFSQYQTLLIE